METNNQNKGFKENFLATFGSGVGLFLGMGVGMALFERIPNLIDRLTEGSKRVGKKIVNVFKGKKIKIVSENNETEKEEKEA